MTLDGLRKFGIADAQASIEYRVYSQLCMPRHANPLFQMEHSFRPTQDRTMSPLIGPDTGKEAIRTAQYSMEHVSALAFLAGTSFAKNHLEPLLPAEVVSQLIKKLRTIGSTMTTLKEKAKARWGTEDPFPGKWRQMGMKGGSSMPTVTITPELHSRLVQFKQVLEAILQQTISFDECIDVTLRLGIQDLLDEILGALPPAALLYSVKEMADRYPTEIYGYLAEKLKLGPMEEERQRLSRQIGFRPDRGGAPEKKDGGPAPESGKQGA